MKIIAIFANYQNLIQDMFVYMLALSFVFYGPDVIHSLGIGPKACLWNGMGYINRLSGNHSLCRLYETAFAKMAKRSRLIQ